MAECELPKFFFHRVRISDAIYGYCAASRDARIYG